MKKIKVPEGNLASSCVEKDLNLMESGLMFKLGRNSRVFEDIVRRDTDLLARLNIMDYSLLVGINDAKSRNAGRCVCYYFYYY